MRGSVGEDPVADPPCLYRINETDDKGFTPISWAASTGNADAVLLLIGSEAVISHPTLAGETPLWFAARYGKEDAVR